VRLGESADCAPVCLRVLSSLHTIICPIAIDLKIFVIVDCSTTDVRSFRKCGMYQTYVATSRRLGEKPACTKNKKSSIQPFLLTYIPYIYSKKRIHKIFNFSNNLRISILHHITIFHFIIPPSSCKFQSLHHKSFTIMCLGKYYKSNRICITR